MSGNRTYRVPKKVQREVDSGMRRLSGNGGSGIRIEDTAALKMASVLMSEMPVDLSVAVEIDRFFTRDWRFHPDKARVASLYGGKVGRDWAHKCAVSNNAVPLVAATEPPITDEEIVELTTFTDRDFQMLLAYGRVATIADDFDASTQPAVAVVEVGPGVEQITEEDLLLQAAVSDAMEFTAAFTEQMTLAAETIAPVGAVPEAGEGDVPKVRAPR